MIFTDMKLKSLLNYLLENVDEAAIRGFSLDILKKKMPEFEKRQYPEDIGIAIRELVGKQYGLPFLGKGSSRAVYALSTGKVLKIAINDKGMAQNEAERIVWQNPSTRYIGAKVFESDPNDHWAVMEVAKIYGGPTPLKLDLGIPRELASSWGYHITSAAFDLTSVYDRGLSVEEVIANRYGVAGPGGDRDPEIEEVVEAFRKFLEDPPNSMLALVDLMYNAPTDHQLHPGDIVPDHFGRTADGRPVLIDYGFTTGVAEGYYSSSSEDGYGSPPPSSIAGRDEEEDIYGV
jgi:hypothetical protein